MLLPDGRVLTLTRREEYLGPHEPFSQPTTSNYRFEYVDPATKELVRWEHDRTLRTVALSIDGGVAELLTNPNYNGKFIYKCPDPPYLAFRYVNGTWTQIPLLDVARKMLRPNMTASSSAIETSNDREMPHLTVADVQRRLPDGWAGNIIDLKSITGQTFGGSCDAPYNYRMRNASESEASND